MHLVLNSFGASIRKENGLFAVSTAAGKQMIPPADVTSISVSKGARISSDAVLLAIEHEIDVLFVDGLGKPQGRVWSIRYGSISSIRRSQVEFLFSPRSVEWARDLVDEKINNQIALLLALNVGQDERTERLLRYAINSMEDHRGKIRKLEGESVSDISPTLRGWEGAASKRYFEALSACLPEGYRFEKRSRQPAEDRFNAMLNYAYGMLYGKVEGALIKAGLDPYTGIFHRDDYNRPALVFDVIEKYRIWADYVVVQLCRQEAMSEECFSETEGLGLMLDGLGKRILIQSVNDYLAEVIELNGLRRSRQEHIQRQAFELASLFQKAAQPMPDNE
ncbi:MAG: CRISPR-associated endonuclease Cas1 [Phaeodactylibacter sp.]|nr:CRISPR-associated endonuclease Cas1 [Phaeodactylibacter sp.]